jgi:hypothetical protein
MDHDEAVRREAAEKYLLGEFSPAERGDFEEHFFDCAECAADLKTTAAFLDGARREFKRGPAARSKPAAAMSWFHLLWRPAFIAPAFAVLLAVIFYQNAVMYPRFASHISQLEAPEILASVSLIGSNSRGGALPSIIVSRAQPVLVSLDVPASAQYSAYSCALVAPSGAILRRVPVSAEQAKDTVSIRFPAGRWESGEYGLIVQGHLNAAGGQIDLARYRFVLHVSD